MDNYTFTEALENIKSTSESAKATIEVATMLSDIIFELSEARIKKGLTQRQLAERCGIKQSAIARMESLKVVPRLDTIAKIAQALNAKLTIMAEEPNNTGKIELDTVSRPIIYPFGSTLERRNGYAAIG